MRFLIIANPTAGRGAGGALAEHVHRLLSESGAESGVALTTARGHAETIARDALRQTTPDNDRRLCLVACGGDGTIQEVVNALLGGGRGDGPAGGGMTAASPPANPCAALGLIPGGRCNDFAGAMSIRQDPRQIADVLLAGHTQAIDIGRINDRYFCTIAAMGFDAAVSRFVHHMKMPLSGTPAYVYGTLRVLMRYKPAAVRLTLDDATLEGPVFLAASANTPCYGGQMRIAPDASATDGMLDLCIADTMGRLRVLRLLHLVIRGRHTRLPEIRILRTRTLRIESDSPQEIWADGEFITTTPVTIEIVPRALELILPASPLFAPTGQRPPDHGCRGA